MGLSQATWYWTAAVGNAGLQSLPTIGRPRDAMRDRVMAYGHRWSTQRAPTLVVLHHAQYVGIFCDALQTRTRDVQGRAMRADFIVVAPREGALATVKQALACFLSASGPVFTVTDGVARLADAWEETLPSFHDVPVGDEWPRQTQQLLVQDREAFAATLARRVEANPTLREEPVCLALFSDWVTMSAMQTLPFALVGGPELRAGVRERPKGSNDSVLGQASTRDSDVDRSRGGRERLLLWAMLTVGLLAFLLLMWLIRR